LKNNNQKDKDGDKNKNKNIAKGGGIDINDFISYD
jgi:hypothetical protein